MFNLDTFWKIKPLLYWASTELELVYPHAIGMEMVEAVKEKHKIQSRALWSGKSIDAAELMALSSQHNCPLYVYSFAYDDESFQILLDTIVVIDNSTNERMV